MKCLLFLFILTSFSCARFADRGPADKKEFRHLVFDIDWTIVSEIKNPTSRDLRNPRVIEVEGLHYYVSDGLEEFVQEVLSHKDMKISFYSGGAESRNLELLSKIKLKNGLSLRDVAYKVLSRKDLVEIPDLPEDARFAERYRKDLTKISSDLDELIMFDDTANFVVETSDNQRDHVYFIGKAYEYFENFSDTKGRSGEYVPQTFGQWQLQRNRMYILNGVFREAYRESASRGIPLSESMKKREELLNLQGHEWNYHSVRLYRKIKKGSASYNRPVGSDCRGSMELFLQTELFP